MMNTLPRIPADFNDLGYEEPNVIPLGLAESFGLRGIPLHDGMSAIFYETGELEARGTLRSKHLVTGEIVWEAVIDATSIHQIDVAG